METLITHASAARAKGKSFSSKLAASVGKVAKVCTKLHNKLTVIIAVNIYIFVYM